MPLIAHTVMQETVVARLRIAFPDAQLIEVHLKDVLQLVGKTSFTALFVDRSSLERGGSTTVAKLKARYPATVLVAYLRRADDLARLAFELGHLQIDEICVMGAEDHPQRLREIVRKAVLRSTARAIERSMVTMPPCMTTVQLERLLSRINDLRCPKDLASALDSPLPRLRRELRQAGLPTPRKLLAWLRVFVAARLLQDSHWSTERVGLELGCSSGTSFLNTCRNTVNATPTEIRKLGGVRFVAERFQSGIDTETCRKTAG